MTINLPPVPSFGTAPTITTLRFKLGTQIGRGEGLNSEVFLAHDLQLETQLAVKRVPKTNLPHSSAYFAEAQRLYDARHRHVAEVKYACEDAVYVYLAMPYYRGGSLQRLLEQGFLSVREIVRYGLGFIAGLNHVHIRGLIHFDVKPTNILLDDSDTATLTDFGLSREIDSAGKVVIVSAYRRHIPPEWLVSGRVSKTADIYQAGMTLYRMCSGDVEFDRQVAYHNVTADASAIRTGAYPERHRFLEHIPPRLRRIVCTALEPDPAKRYATALDLMNALALVEESLDWHYQQSATWGEGTWTESGSTSSRRISLTHKGPSWDVHAWRLLQGGAHRRCPRFCQQNLPEPAARRLVRGALTQPWH